MKRIKALAASATLVLIVQAGAAQAATYELVTTAGLGVNSRVDYNLDTFTGVPAPYPGQPQTLYSVQTLGNGRAEAFAAPGVLKLGAWLDAGTHLAAWATAQAGFSDFLTFTGSTERLRITIDYRVDGIIPDAFLNDVPEPGNYTIPSVYLYSGLRIEALADAGLVSLGGEYTGCDQFHNRTASDTYICGRSVQFDFSNPESIALDLSYTFEVANGSKIGLLADVTASVRQYAGAHAAQGAGVDYDYPATSIDLLNTAVLRGISGQGLTGVESQLLGTLTAIDGNPGAFAYAGAVPEPASWAMLIAGFGLVGAVMRRQARTAVVA